MTPQSKCFIIYLKNPLKVNFTERINYVELTMLSIIKNRTVFLQYRHLLVSLQLKLYFIYNFILIEVRFSLQMPFFSLKLDPILYPLLYWFELSYAESLRKSHSSIRCTLNKIAYHKYSNCWYLCLFKLFQLLKFWRSDRFDISNIYSDERP